MDLLPWQQYVLDTALEVDPVTGLLVYRNIGLTVPRQQGKTTMLLVAMVLRCIGFGRRQMVVYTAQSGKAARQKWEKDHVEALRSSSFSEKIGKHGKGDFKVNLSNGYESIYWPATKSYHMISATGDTSGHGPVLDMPVVDEAFSHSDTRVDAGFVPPMRTRPEPQLWVVSTAGTFKSVYFNSKRNKGRAAVEAGRTSGAAWFEWSADKNADLYDRDAWRGCQPSFGALYGESAILEEIDTYDSEADARRGVLNLTDWGSTGVDLALDLEKWAKQVHRQKELVGRLVVGVAMPPSRSHTSLSIGAHTAEGDLYGEHIETRPGTDWVVEYVADLMERWPKIAGAGVDGGGPAASLIPELESKGITVFKMNASKHADAAGMVHDWLDAGRLWHIDQGSLNDAVAGATKRPLGDRWAFDRRNADVDISPLESMTLALGALVALPEEEIDDGSVYDDRGFVDW